MDQFNRDYAALLGCVVRTYQFDGGNTVEVRAPGAAGVWRGSYEWGEEPQFNKRLTRWLHSLPWPTEDDPRVQHEGVTL